MPEYPGPAYNLPTIAEAAEAATEAVAAGTEAAEAAGVAAAVEAAGRGGAIDITRLPWPGLTRPGFAFVTGCTGQPILGSKGIDARHLIMEARPRN
jgi:hypothetical protein